VKGATLEPFFREYRDGEPVEVGDVVWTFDGAFGAAIVVNIDRDVIYLERPHISVGSYNVPNIMLERFTTGRSKLRVCVTGKAGGKDNRRRE
jgi:hypothetical protein